MLREKPKLKRPELNAFRHRHGNPRSVFCRGCEKRFYVIGAKLKLYQCPHCDQFMRVKR